MPKIKGPRKSNRYPDEFKIRAVKRSVMRLKRNGDTIDNFS